MNAQRVVRVCSVLAVLFMMAAVSGCAGGHCAVAPGLGVSADDYPDGTPLLARVGSFEVDSFASGAAFEVHWGSSGTRVQGAGLGSASCCERPGELRLTVMFMDQAGNQIGSSSTHLLTPGSPFKSFVPPGTRSISVNGQGAGRTHTINDDDWHVNNCFWSYVETSAQMTTGGINHPPFPQAWRFQSGSLCSNGYLTRGQSHGIGINATHSVTVRP